MFHILSFQAKPFLQIFLVPLLGAVFGMPFMVGAVLGMLTLTLGLLVKSAGVPRWIPALWLAFIVLDFSIGAVGPVDPHWLYLVGAVGLAHHITRDRGRAEIAASARARARGSSSRRQQG